MEAIAFAIGLDPVLTRGQQLVDQCRTWSANKDQAPELCESFSDFASDLAECITRLQQNAANLPQQSRAIIDNEINALTASLTSARTNAQSINKRMDRNRVLQFLRANSIAKDCDTLAAKLEDARKLLRDAEKHVDLRCVGERIEKGQKQVIETVQTFQNSFPPSSSTATGSASRVERDAFRAYYDMSDGTSKLVFNFDSKDGNGNTSTQEGKLLLLLLDESPNVHREVAVRGIGGVGKTSLLRGIRCLDRVHRRFEDGVYSILLGMDAKRAELIDSLSGAVQNSGGEEKAVVMRAETDMTKVVNMFRSWFANKQCLFVVDDVWETKEIPPGTIHAMIKLHTSGRDSKVLLTTRSTQIAAEADTYLELQPRDALNYESRAILAQYSGIELQGDEADIKAVNVILERCNGLPLFLAVAGKVVKTLSFRRGHDGSAAYHVYAQSLESSMQSLINTNVGDYEQLSARLKISIMLLEERKKNLEFLLETTMAELHRRLSVVKTQGRVPMSMLTHLWELDDESQAATVAREFEQVGLADVDLERTRSGVVEKLRLHDSVYTFALSETRRHREESTGHEILVRGYGERLTIEEMSGEWWRTCLVPDSYIHENLCRHLLGAGRSSELVQLLLRPQWAERQLSINGVPFLIEDFSTGMKALQGRKAEYSEEDCSQMEEVLQLISETVTLSSGFTSKNHVELYFQLHGRLKRYADRLEGIRKYVGRMEAEAKRPGALCLNDVLRGPGGGNTKIISVGPPLYCVVTLGGGERVACGCEDGSIAVVNLQESEIEKMWKAFDGPVYTIAPGRNGTRLVSGSWDGSMKVWNVATGQCVARFEGHTDIVTGVAVLSDEKRVVSVSADGTAQIWEIDTGQVVLPPCKGHKGAVVCIAVLWDKDEFITGGADGILRKWSTTTGGQVGVPLEGHDNQVNSVAVTADQRRIVSVSDDGTIRIWDVESHKQIAASNKSDRSVRNVAVSRDGSRIVSGSHDGKIRVWDSESVMPVGDPLEGHGQLVRGVSFLESVDLIVSCSDDGTVRVWDARDVRRKKAQRHADRHDDAVWGVSFAQGGKVVVSASGDETLRIWEPTTGEQIGAPLKGHSGPVADVAVTPDRRCAVSVSDDKTVCMWDLESRQVLRTLTGYTSLIWCVAVTPDGTHAVTGSDDKTVRIWNLFAVDVSPVVLQGHSHGVWSVFVTDDGLQIVSVDYENEILVWDFESQNVVKRFKQKDAWSLSRAEVMNLIGETTVHDNAGLSIPLERSEIVYGEEPNATVLATLESWVTSWALSPDKKTVCVGLFDGTIAFLKLEI